MKRSRIVPMLAGFLLLAAAPGLRAAPRLGPAPEPTIYGRDNRYDVYQVRRRLRTLASSTLSLFSWKSLVRNKDGWVSLPSAAYGKDYKLESGERFYNEPDGAFCSGFLVGPDLAVTAGHCVTSAKDCGGTAFVFGYSVGRANSNPTSVPASEVYGCSALVARKYQDDGEDWSLVRLNRPVPDHPPLALDRDSHPRVGEPLFMIGYPSGLPAKVSEDARIVSISAQGYFSADLDDAAGSSGSPVFDARTDLVEGILVRGEGDFVKHGFFLLRPFGFYHRASKICPDSGFAPDSGCSGEDVSEVGPVLRALSAAGPAESAERRPSVNLASAKNALGRFKSAAGDFDGR
ncbi:MAG: trypsin-like peptidase domain-containing protein [Elusimicrobia bacterium]|nr:trypsin-like peptidase domain-containing protein [Elusimicrobiota bacterium]MDE2313635.1 trypsin-like peptidase domain-containing protein [Elusimicrobiota bacterium]